MAAHVKLNWFARGVEHRDLPFLTARARAADRRGEVRDAAIHGGGEVHGLVPDWATVANGVVAIRVRAYRINGARAVGADAMQRDVDAGDGKRLLVAGQ